MAAKPQEMYMEQTVFLIKPYNKYLRPEQHEIIHDIFMLYDNWYCISEVQLQWGQPQVARLLQQQDNYGYKLYNTYQQARSYVHLLKEITK